MVKNIVIQESVPATAEVTSVSHSTQTLPVWIRAPKSGKEFYSGVSRSKLYEWAKEGKIISKCLRKAGNIRGIRLFYLSSIFAYIEKFETVQIETNRD